VTLLDRHTEMSEDFLAEQRERLAGYEGHEIYDITGWSLPLLFGVEAWRAEKDSEGPFASIEAPPSRPWGVLDGREADVAYLVPWTSSASARLLARLTRAGIRVSTAREAFTHDRTEFPAGSLIVRVRDPLGQPDDLHARVDAEARDVGVAVHAVDSSWVDEGVNFGSGRVDRVEASKIALAWGSPTRANSAGATRYVLERRFDLPVTCLPVDRLARTDLDRYDVLILPDGSEGGYAEALGKGGTEALARFVRDGGTLVALADAVRWLAREDVGLLPIERERKGGSEGAQAEGPKREASETDPSPSPQAELGGEAYLRAIRPDIEYPNAIPGAILRVRLDTDHWLAHGYPREICVLADTSRLFGPIRIDRGRNIGIFAPRDEILASGVGWAETLDQAAGKPWLVHRPIGRGNIVAFTEDPTFRASLPGLELSLMNAILRSPRR